MTHPRPKTDIPRYVEGDQVDLSDYVPEMTITELARQLPTSRVWTWPKQPETRAGDIYVFRWGRTHQKINGHHQIIDYPDIYLKFTRHPIRHTSFRYWWAPFELHGIVRTQYMAPGAGSTTDAALAIDDVPLVDVNERTETEWDTEDARLRHPKRLKAIEASGERDRSRFRKKAA